MPRDCCKKFFARIPDEVPVFTLVAYDKVAAATIRDWMARAKVAGVNPFKIDLAEAHLRDFERYALEHPGAMKIPD
jgi:hypothetical protein